MPGLIREEMKAVADEASRRYLSLHHMFYIIKSALIWFLLYIEECLFAGHMHTKIQIK